ncbi:MAG TPA: sugar phosphate nucleotidyltransferase [Longimicrobiales bacterium]|nr:sugar phosphate nucleotidyltransferase [Longimicrobiales bacterium]
MRESTSSSSDQPTIWAVILAGGVGSRFWPLSTPDRPKQLLPLAGDRPMIATTVARILPLVPAERLRILTGERLVRPILDALPGFGIEHLFVEPKARGTAPVLAWAAHRIAREDPDAVMISLHADHVIEPDDEFRALLAGIARLCVQYQRLFTIGVQPTRPETGYGYIRVGQRLGPMLDAYEVLDFVEKPDRDTAQEYLLRGDFLWNSGLFVWPVRFFLDQIRTHTPELATLLPLLDRGEDAEFFDRAPELSIDVGLLERSDRVAVARATFRWDDVGTWDAVGRTLPTDAAGNVRVGDAHVVDSENCIAWSEDGSVVVFGARDLVVVRTGRLTLVLPRERSADLKVLLEAIPEHVRKRVE